MSIVIEAFAEGSNDTATICALNCPVGTNLLVVLIEAQEPGGVGTRYRSNGDVKYNGVNLTLLENSPAQTAWLRTCAIYYLINPPTGASYDVSNDGASSYRTMGHCYALSGADGTFGTPSGLDQSGSPPAQFAMNVASVNGGLVLQHYHGSSSTPNLLSWDSSQIQNTTGELRDGNNYSGGACHKFATSGSTAMYASFNGGTLLHAVCVNPASGAVAVKKHGGFFAGVI